MQSETRVRVQAAVKRSSIAETRVILRLLSFLLQGRPGPVRR